MAQSDGSPTQESNHRHSRCQGRQAKQARPGTGSDVTTRVPRLRGLDTYPQTRLARSRRA